MMLKFIDIPTNIPLCNYDALKSKLTKLLLSHDAVLSVYQMGSVKHPGISDLDIICVFKNGSTCDKNFRSELNEEEKQILTHGIFGVEEKDVIRGFSYNLISNLKYLGGEDLKLEEKPIVTEETIKTQIALEYLIKMLITIDAQVTLKIIKLRAFLLLAKAIIFDLELLGVNKGKLYDLVQNVILYRSQWFTDKPNYEEVTKLILSFNLELRNFLKTTLIEHKLYLPSNELKLPGNFMIKRSTELAINHKGFILPKSLSFLGRKYISVQHRLNSFTYHIPFEIPDKKSEHFKRFEFSKGMANINRQKYPHFIPLTTSLSIY
ncbi:hypothetical protein [Winogradskyella sp.]|uniref:hypothetical protein n=1 Tax=Winogradskyella sp. TaxID=1883156 RepID=UPI0035185ECA